jgi:hypothetical protein
MLNCLLYNNNKEPMAICISLYKLGGYVALKATTLA